MQVGEEQDSDGIQTDLGKQVLLFTEGTSSACWKPKYCWNFFGGRASISGPCGAKDEGGTEPETILGEFNVSIL